MGCCESKHNNFGLEGLGGRHITSKDLITFKDRPISEQYELELVPFHVSVRNETKRAVHKLTGKIRAVRIVSKKKVDGEKLRSEVSILRNLDHPNIVKIIEIFQDVDHFYIVTEYYNGKDLLNYLDSQETISEATAVNITRQILSALSYMHKHGIVHLGMRPDSIIFESDKENAPIKLLNFSSAKIYRNDTPMSTFIGSYEYAAPEMFEDLYTDSVDIWACGILFYLMIAGNVPFTGDNKKEIAHAIQHKELSFTGSIWSNISTEVKSLISRMLDKDMGSRISIEEALQHFCFKSSLSHKKPDAKDVEQVLSNLKRYKVKNKVQNAIWVFMVNFLIQKEEKEKLLKIFSLLDTNHDGVLTRDEILNGFKSFYKTSSTSVVDKIFKQLDQQNSGSIDYSDFVASVIDHKIVLSKSNLETAFKLLDSDQSGGISVSELKEAFGAELNLLDDDFWLSLVKEADKNGDNEIQFQEFLDIMNTCKGG